MAVLKFTLSEEGVSGFRDALICLNKFSDEVSLEARKDSFILSTLNNSKSAYASFKFATHRFFSRYNYQGTGSAKERFHCNMYIRASTYRTTIISITAMSNSLISLFRSRSAADSQRDRDAEKQTLIDRCDITIEDGQGVRSRFVARIVFRTGLTSTHRLIFETGVPVHAKFSKTDAPHHWSMSSRTLRQLMDHFGPGIDYLDINTDGDRVNFTCFSEKTVKEDAVLRKPLQTSIAVEADEFDDIEVEDKLHIVISVKDFRAIIHHAGIGGSALSARYSLPARPIQFSYAGDALSCEFLIMTVGERGSNSAQKTKKGRKSAPANNAPRLEATSRNTSVAAPETPAPHPEMAQPPTQASAMAPPPSASRPVGTIRASVSRMSAFDLRPSQKPPPPTLRSESLFVDDEGWEPVRDEDEDVEENAQLGWDHSADPDLISTHSFMHMSRADPTPFADEQSHPPAEPSTVLEPTQKLADVENLALFPD